MPHGREFQLSGSSRQPRPLEPRDGKMHYLRSAGNPEGRGPHPDWGEEGKGSSIGHHGLEKTDRSSVRRRFYGLRWPGQPIHQEPQMQIGEDKQAKGRPQPGQSLLSRIRQGAPSMLQHFLHTLAVPKLSSPVSFFFSQPQTP